MGISKLVHLSVLLATIAASTGQLPKIVNKIRLAHLQLIQDSKASKWGSVMLLR
jgi:recombinational DNA repair ATPase RecF